MCTIVSFYFYLGNFDRFNEIYDIFVLPQETLDFKASGDINLLHVTIVLNFIIHFDSRQSHCGHTTEKENWDSKFGKKQQNNVYVITSIDEIRLASFDEFPLVSEIKLPIRKDK